MKTWLKNWQITSPTPYVNTHIVPIAHLLPAVYLMAYPLVNLPGIVPKFAKSYNYLQIVSFKCDNQNYQIINNKTNNDTIITSTEANLTGD